MQGVLRVMLKKFGRNGETFGIAGFAQYVGDALVSRRQALSLVKASERLHGR